MPEIELHRRYPESRLEDITDAFNRGYMQGMEAKAIVARQNGKTPPEIHMAKRIEELEAENAKLRELATRMGSVLGVDNSDPWADPDWCQADCACEFGCRGDGVSEIRCPIVEALNAHGCDRTNKRD